MSVPVNKLYEAMSAMQKCIRRGLEADAGYWFWLMAENGWAKAALMRTKVTAYEDVGLGDAAASAYAIRSVDDALAWLAAGNDAWRLPAAAAVLVLCRAQKSREADHYQAAMRADVILDARNGAIRPTPDWALDKHTRTGKRLGRGIEHFRTEGSKLHPAPAEPDAYEEAAYAAWSSSILEATVEQPGLFNPDAKEE